MTEILDTPASTQLRENLFPDRDISRAHIAELIRRAHPLRQDNALIPQEPRIPVVSNKAAQKLTENVLSPGS